MSAYHLIPNTVIHMRVIEQIFIEDLYARFLTSYLWDPHSGEVLALESMVPQLSF